MEAHPFDWKEVILKPIFGTDESLFFRNHES